MEATPKQRFKFNTPILAGVVAFCLLASGIIYNLSRASAVPLDHAQGNAGSKPRLLGEIKTPNHYPLGILANGGKLYVTFYQDEQVSVYNSNGRKIKEFPFKVKGEKGYPLNMTVLNQKLFITDFLNGAMGIYDLDGKPLDGFWTTGDNKALKPVGVTANKNMLYVTDNNLLGFFAITPKGEIINTVKPDKEKAKLYYPWGIVVTKDGRALITDFKGSRVKVFNCAGWYSYDFETGKGTEILNSPEGIAIDGLNRVHVADKASNKIFVYDNYGKFQFTYGQGLNGPSGISIDIDKRIIYVANTEKNEVAVYGY